MNSICESNKCTGCGACLNICAKNAISMCEGELGHIYPKINNEKCIDCGLCAKICPSNNPVQFNEPNKAYAAWAKDETEYKTSTSGGAAAVFTNYVLTNGGVVYGSIFDGKVIHKRIDNLQEAFKLKGSKYVQSHTEETFIEAKNDLDKGMLVLYIGTPCQIAGFKAFLNGKEYDNLITVDLICHGVPSQKVLFDHINSIGFENSKVQNISFRGADGKKLKVISADNEYCCSGNKDLYYIAFFSNINLRESCYTCQYAQGKRISDITIGDFWGLGKKVPFKEKLNYGISVILTNTTKGEQLVEKCKEEINLVERTVEEAVNGNRNLRKPSLRAKDYSKFLNFYGKMPIKKAFRKSMRVSIIKSKLIRIVSFLLRTLRRTKK